MKRGTVMVDAGCDGLIVSGHAIRTCRHAFGPTLTLVSPGIRPAWAGRDDHARLTTPAQAIHLGSDYLVVGRPIRTAQSPHDAAQRIIDEIDEALVRPDKVANSPEPTTRPTKSAPLSVPPLPSSTVIATTASTGPDTGHADRVARVLANDLEGEPQTGPAAERFRATQDELRQALGTAGSAFFTPPGRRERRPQAHSLLVTPTATRAGYRGRGFAGACSKIVT